MDPCSRSPPSRRTRSGRWPSSPGCGGAGPVPIGELARRREVPVQFLEQLFAVLRRAGVLRSQRGVKGGYAFAREPGEVTVLEVVELLDGRLGADAEGIFAEAAAAARTVLAKSTIADVVERENQAAGATIVTTSELSQRATVRCQRGMSDRDLEALRRHGFGVAYRMLGSVTEAEDVAQEALLRLTRQEEEIAEPAAWMTTVVTRLSINVLKSARTRREAYVGPWLPEPLLEDPAPGPASRAELADSLSLALLCCWSG